MAYTEADSHFWHKDTEMKQKLVESAKFAHFFSTFGTRVTSAAFGFFLRKLSVFWLIWIFYGRISCFGPKLTVNCQRYQILFTFLQ